MTEKSQVVILQFLPLQIMAYLRYKLNKSRGFLEKLQS